MLTDWKNIPKNYRKLKIASNKYKEVKKINYRKQVRISLNINYTSFYNEKKEENDLINKQTSYLNATQNIFNSYVLWGCTELNLKI